MYLRFFGLERAPFSIAPDPRSLFMSERHREALAHLLYGLDSGGGVVLLTGEIGAGKTTVCRCFLEQVPSHCQVAYVFNPKLTGIELLKGVCDEFHIVRPEDDNHSIKAHVDALNRFLLQSHAQGGQAVLVIDEAQNLSTEVLEQLRLLTNLETNERKLLQIVLIGQPELREMLRQPQLEQLAQRVVARCHLQALDEADTARYIAHRLRVAGLPGSNPFSAALMRRIHRLSGGVPRRINLLCDRALLGAYAGGLVVPTRRVLDQAAREVFDRGPVASPPLSGVLAAGPSPRVLGGLLLAGLLGLGGAWWWQSRAMPGQTAEPMALAATEPASASASAATEAGVAGAASSSALLTAATPASAGASGVAEPVLAAAATEASLPLAQQLATLQQTEDQAWRALARRWPPGLPDSGPACQAARQVQLQCQRGNSSLALIRQLDRPGWLLLRDTSQRPVPVLLTGLDHSHATLQLGQRSQRVPLAALAEHWRGDFATLWRSPPGFPQQAGMAVVDAQSGPVTSWLATQLGRLADPPDPPGAPTTAEALNRRVAAFQRAQGLPVDGMAGPQTFMQLNRAIGVDEPRLLSE